MKTLSAIVLATALLIGGAAFLPGVPGGQDGHAVGVRDDKEILSEVAKNPSAAAEAEEMNSSADNIVGVYGAMTGGDVFEVRVTKLPDGGYEGRICWVRGKESDNTLLFSGMRYDPKKKCWSGAKVYDPHRGVRAPAKCVFIDKKNLIVGGSFMGIKAQDVWTKQ